MNILALVVLCYELKITNIFKSSGWGTRKELVAMATK